MENHIILHHHYHRLSILIILYILQIFILIFQTFNPPKPLIFCVTLSHEPLGPALVSDLLPILKP